MRTFTRPAAVVTFFLAALAPVLLLNHDGPRYGAGSYALVLRAPFPSKLTPGMFRQASTWFADRIGLRNLLLNIGADLNIGLLGLSVNRKVLIGRDGWLFWTDDDDRPAAMMSDARGEQHFTPPEISRIESNFRRIGEVFAACGKTALVAVAANKQSIYGEQMLAENPGRSTRLDDLMAKLDPSILAMVLDSREPLRAAKRAQGLPLYFKSDTHWNELGAFSVYRAMIERMVRAGNGVDRPELASLDHYDIEIMPYQGGDLGVLMLYSPWRFPDVRVRMLPKPTVPAVTVVADGLHTVFSNPQGKGRLVLIGDSFSPLLATFLARHFERVYQYTPMLQLDGDLVAQNQADVTVLEIVERHLPYLLQPLAGLERVCTTARK